MPRYSAEQRQIMTEQNRKALLESAAKQFALKGFLGANINQISAAAGFAKGTVYNYFESKRDLMKALIRDTAVLHLDHIQEAVKAEASPSERLQAFFEAGFEFVELYHDRAQAIINNLFGPDVGFREEMFLAYHDMFKLVAEDILFFGVSQEAFRELEAEETANLVMLVYLGIASQTNPAGKPWVKPAQVADLFVRSLGAD